MTQYLNCCDIGVQNDPGNKNTPWLSGVADEYDADSSLLLSSTSESVPTDSSCTYSIFEMALFREKSIKMIKLIRKNMECHYILEGDP